MALIDYANKKAQQKAEGASSASGGYLLKYASKMAQLKKQDKDAYNAWREENSRQAQRYVDTQAKQQEMESFYDRYNALLDSYNETYAGGQQWQSESQRQAWEKTLSDYRTEAAGWESWVKQHTDIYGSDASQGFDAMWNQLGEMQSGVKRAGEVYGQYGSEEEYNTARDNAKRIETYKGRSPEEIQADISRMEREGVYYENVRLEGDEYRVAYDRAVQEKADAERKLKDAQLSGASQSIISEYQAEVDKASAAVKLLEDEQSIAEERNKYQADIDWLREYAPHAGYYYGEGQYGYSLAEMKPYEILDITPQSEGEQAWIEDYVENEVARGGYIGAEDWAQVAEAQRAYDSIAPESADAVTSLAEDYNNWQMVMSTEAGQYQEKRFWEKLAQTAADTGMSEEELMAIVQQVQPYVAKVGADEFRASVEKTASELPWWLSTAVTYAVQPIANLQAGAYLMTSEALGGTPTAANPALQAYTFTTGTRGQVAEDLDAKYGSGTASFLYNTVNSTVDSTVNFLLTRGVLGAASPWLSTLGEKGAKAATWALQNTVSNLIMGSGASAQRFVELKQAGYEDEQAIAGAASAGFIEGLTEAIGGDRLSKALVRGDSFFVELLRQGLSEGVEEVGSNELNGLVNWLAYGEDSAPFIRKVIGLFGGYQAAGYDSEEAMQLAFSEAAKENWESFLSGALSGMLQFGGGAGVQQLGRAAAETYSYAKDVRSDSSERAAVNAYIQQQRVAAPQISENDNILRVMQTVRAAANEANYNSTKEAVRQVGLMLREELTENGEVASDDLIAAINKTTVAESISAVRQLSRDESRLLTLTKAEQKALDSKGAKQIVKSLEKLGEDGISAKDRNRRAAMERSFGFAEALEKIHGEATDAAVEAVNHAYRVGKTFNGAAPTLDVVLKDERYAAADRDVVTQAWEAGRDFNKEATVTEDGNIELKGATPAALAVMNEQYGKISDEDSRAEYHRAVAAAYFTGVYYAGTEYGAAQINEIYAEHGDIEDELRAVYEQGAKEREGAGDNSQSLSQPAADSSLYTREPLGESREATRKRGSVRNITREEAAAAGVSTVDTSKLTKRQKTEGKILRSLARQMGFDVVFFDSMRADGTQAGANGWYSNGTIYIDVNAGYINDTSMLRTTAHELTHFIQQYNAEAYSKLRDFIVDRYYEADKKAFEAEVKRIIDAQKLSEGAAVDEVVADGCQMMLRDSKAPQMLYEHDAKLYDKVSAWVREWANKLGEALKKALADVAPNSATARALSQTADTMTELQKLWDEALVGAVENKAKSPAVNSEAVQYELRGVNKNGIEVYETSPEVMQMSINDRKKEYLRLMQYVYRGRTARFVRNGHTYYAQFDRKSIRKPIYGDNRSSKAGVRALINAGADGDFFDLVENAEYSRSQRNTKNHTNADYFDYFVKTVQIDGRMFDLVADVEKQYGEEDGYVYTLALRDNTKIKASPALSPPETVLVKGAGNASNTTLPQSMQDVKQYSMRDPAQMAESMSDREVLAQALLSTAQNEAEIEKLTEYQQQIGEYNAKEARLSEVGKQLRELSFKEGPRDKAKIEALQAESAKLKAELNRFDKTLLTLEATAPLKALAERQRQAAVKAARTAGRETLKEYRTKRNESDAVKKYRKRIETTANTLLDWLTKNSDKKHVPEELKGPLVEFLEALDMSSDRSRAGGDQTKKELAYIRKFNRMRNAIESGRITVEGGTLDLGDAVTEAFELMAEVPVYEMDAKQLRLVMTAMTSIKTAVTKANETFLNKRYAETAAMAEESIKDYDELAKAADKNPILKALNSWAVWQNSTPYYAFRRLGPVGESLFEEMQEGWAKLAQNSKRIEKFATDTYNESEVKDWGQQIIELKLESGQTVKMSATQAMSLYALSKRAAAQRHLLQGGIKLFDVVRKVNKLGKTETISHNEVYHLTLNDLAAIAGSLSERQIEVADKLQQFMTQVGAAWGNEVTMARFGYKAYGEKNYFPMTSDPNVLIGVDVSGNKEGSDLYRLVNQSHTKGLVEGANNTLAIGDMFEVFSGHMSDMAKYNALVLPMLDMVKWLNYKGTTMVKTPDGKEVKRYDRSVQRSLENAFGKKTANGKRQGVAAKETSNAVAYIKQFVADLNGASNIGVAPGYITKFMGRYKKSAVAANLRVAIQQPTSIARAAAVISPKYLKEGAKHFRSGSREMLEHSGEAIWKDMGFFDTNIGTPLADKLMYRQSKIDRLGDKAMWLAEQGDKATWGMIWSACKAEMSDKGYKDTELIQKTAERFRQVIYATQVMDATTTRSGWMRSNNPLAKMGTAFMSEPTLSVNIAVDAVYQYARDVQKGGDTADARSKAWSRHKGHIMGAFTALAINKALTAVAASLIDAWRDDDDFETFWEKYTDALGGNLIDAIFLPNDIPFVGEIFQGLFTNYGTGGMDTALIAQAKKVLDIGKDLWNVHARGMSPTEATYYGKMSTYGAIYEVLKLASNLSGLPLGSASRDVAAAWNLTIGNMYPDLKLKTYNESPTAGYEKLYEAIVSGDEDAERKLLDLFEELGYGDDAIADGLKAQIKDHYLSGDLDEDEAKDLLISEGYYSATGTGSDSANYQIDSWDYVPEGDERFSMYRQLQNALGSGDAAEIKAAAKETSRRYGLTLDDIKGAITEEYKPLYVNGNDAERRRIRQTMLDTGFYTKDELDDKLAGWPKQQLEAQLKDAYIAADWAGRQEIRRELQQSGLYTSDEINKKLKNWDEAAKEAEEEAKLLR